MATARQLDLINSLRALDSETPWVEFKENNSDVETIGRNISAIANSSRLSDRNNGFIIWGIRDNDHEIVGTTFQPGNSVKGNQPLQLWLSQMLDPPPHLDFQVFDHERGRIVLLEISAATQYPTRFNREAYIRIGSATTQLSRHPDTERILWSRLQPYAWESGIAMQYVTSSEVLELIDYPSYFELVQHPLPDNRDGIFERLLADRLIARDVGNNWNILNLGALLFGKRLDRFERLARKVVRIIEYEANDRTKTHRRQESTRGYASGFSWLIDAVNGMLPRNEHIGRAFREVQPVYPEIAVRELVANALIHQDMTITGAGPIIEIFPDRIEITNPGAPLNEPSRLIDLPPRSRNEAMAALMRRMNICEEQGSGLDKVIASVELFQLPPPEFRVEANNMKVIMLSPRQFAHMTAAERLRATYQHAVLRFLTNEKLTNASLRARFGIEDQNAAQVSRILRDATSANLIRLADPASPRAGYIPSWA
ncbi:putative HTH transcriptional regulator [Angulomicrobium tetraedrale]|uniref:Putative HTH transcriptional regulator n=1 Tax=Ancylobacter tetraedralis TaxID=217068 RepID=A0A839Z8Z2_9HYPH|nr:ATP-binding protein [Ancylobacter tetraedralis]MBB3770998.1 putative HTH transcriptional regulator [Ancylobacter tetraedralis]